MMQVNDISEESSYQMPATRNCSRVGAEPIAHAGTWFDTSAFARPTGARFGTVGRNTMRGPSMVSADASLFRAFKLKERLNLQLRAEGFNITNTPHFGNPNSDANSSNFGKILDTDPGLAQGRSREFRFGLRLGF